MLLAGLRLLDCDACALLRTERVVAFQALGDVPTLEELQPIRKYLTEVLVLRSPLIFPPER